MSAPAGSNAAVADDDREETRERKIAQLDAMWNRTPIMVSTVDKRIHKLSRQSRKQEVDARARKDSGCSTAMASTAIMESQSVAESQSDGPVLGDAPSVLSGMSEAESFQEARDGSEPEGIRTPSSEDMQELDIPQSYSTQVADSCSQSQAFPAPVYFHAGVPWTAWMHAAPHVMQQKTFAPEQLLGDWLAADGQVISVRIDAASNRLEARLGKSWRFLLEMPTGGCDWRCGDAVLDSAHSSEWQLVWRMSDGSHWVWWAAQQVSSSQWPHYAASAPSSSSGARAAARPRNAAASAKMYPRDLEADVGQERTIHPSMFIFGTGHDDGQSSPKTKTGRKQKKPGGNENLFDASEFPALAGSSASTDKQRRSPLGSGEAEKPGA